MIYLQNNKINTVALTLSEKDEVGVHRDYYLMDITNLYTLEQVNDIRLYEINTNTSRFNQFLVSLSTLDELTISSDTTLLPNFVYVINGELTILEGVTLTIPETSTILCTDIMNYGTIVNDETIIIFNGDLSNIHWSINTSLETYPLTLLYNLPSGFYSYSIRNEMGTILETGRMKLQDNEQPATEYTPN